MNCSKIDFFIVDHTPIGGVQRVSCTLMNLLLLNKIGIDYLITQHNDYEKPHFSYPKQVEYINLNCSKDLIEDKLYEQFVKLNIKNIIFSGDNMSISIALLKAAKRAGVIAIPQYHGSPHAYLDKYISNHEMMKNPYFAFKYLITQIFRPFKLLKLKKYLILAEHGVACVSHGSAEEIRNLYKNSSIINDRVFTIYNPLTFELNNIVYDGKSKKNHIVYLSRLEKKHKNSFLVIKAWNLIAHKYPDWELHILGDGSLNDPMKNFAKQNKLTNVFFHGMVTEISKFLSISKISILSSNCEGLGMGIVESICYKNAIVSTLSNGGIIDLVKHEVSGLLVPRNDHKAFAQSIEKLMNNEELRIKYANASYEILNNFSDELIVNQWKTRFGLNL